MFFKTNPGFTRGRVIQFRETFRDFAGGLVNAQQGRHLQELRILCLGRHGHRAPVQRKHRLRSREPGARTGSGRTTCAWADMLHFSGCKGLIRVDTVRFSGSHDDPINVHGTHLRVVGKPAAGQILVRFVHPQTYGLEAFSPGRRNRVRQPREPMLIRRQQSHGGRAEGRARRSCSPWKNRPREDRRQRRDRERHLDAVGRSAELPRLGRFVPRLSARARDGRS